MGVKSTEFKECLREHSMDQNVTVENHNGETIYHFDLSVDNSENKWGEIQPLMSAVSVDGDFVSSYNIRIGEVDDQETVEHIRKQVMISNPPCLDRFDTGHSEDVLQPHIRMNSELCSVEEFTRFMDRLMIRLDPD